MAPIHGARRFVLAAAVWARLAFIHALRKVFDLRCAAAGSTPARRTLTDAISIEPLQKGTALPPREPWLSMPNSGSW
jgi:hypothetical protein